MRKFIHKTGLAVAISGIATSALGSITSPEVLHRFTTQGDMAFSNVSEMTNLGRNPHLAPVYVEATGKLYGLTPEGGALQGAYGVNYSLTPNAEVTDYVGQSSTLNVLLGFFSGLAVDSEGALFGAANPQGTFFPNDAASGFLFQWTDAHGMSNATAAVDTETLYGSHFDLRGLLAVDEADNVYFGGGSDTNGMSLFRKKADGSLEQLVDFTLYQQGDTFLKGQYPAAVIVSNDGESVYGLTVRVGSSVQSGDPEAVPAGDVAVGTLFKVATGSLVSDGSSPIEVLHTFAEEAEGLVQGSDSGQHALVEVGEWIYGTTTKAVWRIKKTDAASFELVHTFGSDEAVSADGGKPHGNIVLAEDGNVYGTTQTSTDSDSPAVAGTLYKITIDGDNATYQQLHTFNAETDGAAPVGLNSGPSVDGLHTLFGATKFGGQAGDSYDGGFGTVYSVQVQIPGSLQVTLDQSQITLGESITLTWTSSYLASCAGLDDLTGDQAVAGSLTLTPDQAATYDYTIDCLDVHGNSVKASVSLEVAAVEEEPEPDENQDPDSDESRSTDSDSSDSSGAGAMSTSAFLLLLTGLFTRRRLTRRV